MGRGGRVHFLCHVLEACVLLVIAPGLCLYGVWAEVSLLIELGVGVIKEIRDISLFMKALYSIYSPIHSSHIFIELYIPLRITFWGVVVPIVLLGYPMSRKARLAQLYSAPCGKLSGFTNMAKRQGATWRINPYNMEHSRVFRGLPLWRVIFACVSKN